MPKRKSLQGILFEKGVEENIKAYIQFLEPIEIVDLFYELDESYFEKIIYCLDLDTLSKILPILSLQHLQKIFTTLEADTLLDALNLMETDDIAEVFRQIDLDIKELLLPKLIKFTHVSRILNYTENSAGSIMKTEVCIVKTNSTVKEAIQLIREQKKKMGRIHTAYLVNENKKLIGIVPLDDLIIAKFDAPIETLTTDLKYYTTPEIDQEEVALEFNKYDINNMPVIDKESGILLGQITIDDIQDVINEEVSEDLLSYAGIANEKGIFEGENLKLKSVLGRFPWLIFSISASLLTGLILTLFKKTAGDAIIYASFVPLIMNTTGNVGTQTAMIITRGFALGANEFGRFNLPISKELAIGNLLGILAGTLTFLLVWFFYNDIGIALRVGSTLIISMTAAALFGMVIPLFFKRIGIDPAVASGPLVTSGCDLLSVSLYLGIILLFNSFSIF